MIVKYCTIARVESSLKQGLFVVGLMPSAIRIATPWVTLRYLPGWGPWPLQTFFSVCQVLGNKKGWIRRRNKYVFCYTDRQSWKRPSTSTTHSLLNVYFYLAFRHLTFKCIFRNMFCEKVEDCFYFLYSNYLNYSADVNLFFFFFFLFPSIPFCAGQARVMSQISLWTQSWYYDP